VLADLVEESPRQPESGPARAFTPPRPTKSILFHGVLQSVDWSRRVIPWGRH
jgi:hypothetical protein